MNDTLNIRILWTKQGLRNDNSSFWTNEVIKKCCFSSCEFFIPGGNEYEKTLMAYSQK